MLDRLKAWQADQLQKGEARLERLNARAAELDAAIAEDRAVRAAEAPPRAEKVPSQPRAHRGRFKGESGTLAFSRGVLRYSGSGKNGSAPLGEVREVRVEDGSEFRRRATLGRTGGGAIVGGLLFGPVGLLAGMGLGAVAAKESGGEKYLTVETESAAFAVEVPRKQISEAQDFAAALRNAAKASQ